MNARTTYFGKLIISVTHVVSLLLPLSVILALAYFLWGLTQFIFNAGSEANVKVGRDRMFWGVVTLFVMISVWGLVSFLGGVFNVNTRTSGGGGSVWAGAPGDCGGDGQPECNY
jgi:K+-transporting ATPase A subunit